MASSSNGNVATPGNGSSSSNGNSQPGMKKQSAQMRRRKGMANSSMGNGVAPQMKSRGMRGSKKLKANSVVFSNGTSLETQVKNMQQNLDSISGRKKSSMEGGQNNNSLATLHNKIDIIANNVENIKSYQVQTWDLKRARKYGSDHYNTKTLIVKNATLSKDRKEIFLTIMDVKPTNVMEVAFQLLDDTGKPIKGLIQNTINQIGK
jgi:hypothetical protein